MLAPVEKELHSVEGVDDVAMFSFKGAMDNFDELKRAAAGSVLVGHSAGNMAMNQEELRPNAIVAFNAPLPTGIGLLMLRANLISFDHFLASLPGREDADANRAYLRAAMQDIMSMKSFIGNVRHLRAVSRFNAVTVAAGTQSVGIQTILEYTDGDRFFQPTINDRGFAHNNGVRIHSQPGMHNDLLTQPNRIITGSLLSSVVAG